MTIMTMINVSMFDNYIAHLRVLFIITSLKFIDGGPGFKLSIAVLKRIQSSMSIGEYGLRKCKMMMN